MPKKRRLDEMDNEPLDGQIENPMLGMNKPMEQPNLGAFPPNAMNQPHDMENSLDGQKSAPTEAVSAMSMHKIGENEISKAMETLRKYKSGKANLEKRLVENEQWWKMRHWSQMDNNSGDNDPTPASGWLFNCIISKHADAMDSYPTFNCLPREQADREEAERLSDILPVVIEQNGFESTFSEEVWQKLKGGTGVFGVFWDTTKLNGLGDISIQNIDLLNLFWQPGVKDIQKSRNVFHTELVDNEILEQRYPQLVGNLGGGSINVSKYIYDDNVDTTDKSVVVDWYYHTEYGGKKVLQYCKFVGNTVLFATENEQGYENGWYEHGEYPFVFDSLFPMEGTPCGFGYIDVCKDAQKYIDVMNQALIKNMCWGATPRFLMRQDGSVNEAEFADLTKPFVHTNGSLSEDALRQINVSTLDDGYITLLNNKIDELKETSGNRDVNNGGGTAGATAASAISALQEASGKTSRDSTMTSYRAYKGVIWLCIELIRQFYDLPRQFRIVGERGQEKFVQYSNAGIKPQSQGVDFGIDMGMRKPVFDLEVSAQKNSPYSKLSQNELALQFFQLGFFNPQLTDQALACIDMMDFDGKDDVSQKISENGTLAQQLAQYQQMALALAQRYEPQLADGLAMSITGDTSSVMPKGLDDGIQLDEVNSDGSFQTANPIADKARENTREMSRPK